MYSCTTTCTRKSGLSKTVRTVRPQLKPRPGRPGASGGAVQPGSGALAHLEGALKTGCTAPPEATGRPGLHSGIGLYALWASERPGVSMGVLSSPLSQRAVLPALMKSSVGSSCGTTGDDGQCVCAAWFWKNSTNVERTWLTVVNGEPNTCAVRARWAGWVGWHDRGYLGRTSSRPTRSYCVEHRPQLNMTL